MSLPSPEEPASDKNLAPAKLLQTFRAFRNYNYRLFWCGQLVSVTGSWMQLVGQAWLVLELTDSPLALGTVTALQFLPILAFSLFAGVLADRYPKRRLLLITQTVAMLQALALAILVATNSVQLWHVYALATVLGLVNSVDNPTRQAFAVEMVGRDNLINAVALNSSLFNSARLIGPALGGALIATVGIAACFFLNAFSFAGTIIALLLMKDSLLHVPPRRPSHTVLQELREGISYAARTPAILLVVIVLGVLGLFGYNFLVALPLLARESLRVDAAGFGLLTSAMGLGSVGAALVVATVGRPSRRALLVGASIFTILLGLVAQSSSYLLSIVLLALLGASGITFTTMANSTMQLNTPDHLRGRVVSMYTFLFNGTTPIGAMITGWLADNWDIQRALVIEAAVCVLGVLAGICYHLFSRGRSLTRPGQECET